MTEKEYYGMIDSVALAPFYVEYRVQSNWDLWRVVDDEEMLEFEVELLQDRGFEYRVKDSAGKELVI